MITLCMIVLIYYLLFLCWFVHACMHSLLYISTFLVGQPFFNKVEKLTMLGSLCLFLLIGTGQAQV